MDQLSKLIKGTVFSVREANFATVGDFWKDIVFFYKHCRLYYITEGTADLVLKGTTLHLQPHRLYYIPSYSVLTANCDTFFSHHFIHFQFDGILNTFSPSLQLHMEAEPLQGDEQLFSRVQTLVNHPSDRLDETLELNGIMQILLSRFLQKTDASPDILRFSKVIEYIDNNLDKKITVEELAGLLYLNKVYFSNAFTKCMGVTPSQLIIEKKLSRAMHLLRNETMSTKEIAFSLGFNNEAYFSRLFKNKTKLTPSEFRKNVQKNNNI